MIYKVHYKVEGKDWYVYEYVLEKHIEYISNKDGWIALVLKKTAPEYFKTKFKNVILPVNKIEQVPIAKNED